MKPHIITAAMLLLSLGKSFARLNESDTLRFQFRASLTASRGASTTDTITVRNWISEPIYLFGKDFTLRPCLLTCMKMW